MKCLVSYLTFDGNCREAMTFYQECLGGELVFQTIGESPLGYQMPPELKPYILLATLSNGPFVIRATDMTHDEGIICGNAVALMLHCSSAAEVNHCYRQLAKGGTADHLPENTFWGGLQGDLTDKFGNRWLLHYAEE